MVHDLLHFKSILNAFRQTFCEETTPQSSCVLESSTTFDRQKFLLIYASENFFVIPKRFKSEKQVFMQESGYHSGLISKHKDHKNLPVSLFLPEANLRVDH